MAEKISCVIEDRREYSNGVVRLTMRMLESTRSDKTTNPWGSITPGDVAAHASELAAIRSALATYELPNIIHTIARSGLLQSQNPLHTGFDYALDFVLTDAGTFPYVLDFKLKE